jgi:hypothetical protein
MKFRFTCLLLCFAIAGCQVGPRIEKFEQARRPEGIATTIELRSGLPEGGRLKGELLEVRDHGLLLNTRETREDRVSARCLVFVPYTAIEDVEFDRLNLRVVAQHNEWIQETRPPSVRDREKLRLLSRFPQGLSTPLLEQLLEAEGQTAVEVIRGN